MKGFSKIMLSTAAVAAVTAAMAASAMAADDFTAAYDDGTVSLTGVATTGASQTLLVLNDDVSVTADNASTVIEQIDQKDDGTAFDSFVMTSGLTEGTYYVRIGGTDGTMQTATLTISSGGGQAETTTVLVGDANLSEDVAIDDALAVATYLVDSISDANGNTSVNTVVGQYNGMNIAIGDANLDGDVAIDDALAIATYLVDSISDANGNTSVNTELTVTLDN